MKHNKGFTLMEILTVIVIIAVLMGVAFPQYRKVVQKSYGTQAITMLRSLYDSSERLAMQKGYKSYANLGSGTLSQMDFYDDRPAGCVADSTGYLLNCTGSNISDGLKAFQYKVNVTKDANNHYVAAKKLNDPYKDTYLALKREDHQIYCQGTDDSCSVYGFDHTALGISF